MPEAEDELPEAVQLLLARRVVDAVNHRTFDSAALVGLAFAAELRDAAVGQQHELLDHLVRFLLLLEIDAQRFACLVEFEFHLFAVEADRAVLEPLPAKRLRQPVERQYLFGVVAAARLDHLLRLGIGEAAVGVDHRAAEPLFEDVEVLIEGEDRRETETRFVRAERTKLVRKPFGQHRHGAVHQIDRGAAFDGFVVDRRLGAHVVRHVGDMHADLPDAVPDPAHRKRVVEVLGVGRVHREGRYLPEVAACGDLLGGDAAVDGLCGLLYFGVEAVGQLVFGQNGVHLRVVVARHAEPFDQLAHGAFAAFGPVGDADHDLFAVLHVGVLLFREVDVHRHAARVGPHEDLVRAHLGHADVGFAAAFDDARDFAFEFPVAAAVDGHHLHAVAVQGVGRVALIDENIVLLALDPHVYRTARRHVGDAFEVGQVLVREPVFLAGALLDDAFVVQASQYLERFAASLFRRAARSRREVFEREFIIGEFTEETQDDCRPVRVFRAPCGTVLL